MPAMRFTTGFMILYKACGQNFARNIAHRMPIGTPITTAPIVTYMLPIIIGRMPNILFFGFHSVPVRKFTRPIWLMAENPFLKRNMHIRTTASTETHAVRKKTACIRYSVNFFIITGHPMK